MDNDNFDKAFDVFIESNEYDKAQNALLSMMRISFQAGWQAARAASPEPPTRIKLLSKKPDNESPE